MSDLVDLTCLSCGEPWQMERRQGQYPNRCPACTSTELTARQLQRRARTLGLRAETHNHHRQGTVCVVQTPWHDQAIIVRDTTDLAWLLAELAASDREAAAA